VKRPVLQRTLERKGVVVDEKLKHIVEHLSRQDIDDPEFIAKLFSRITHRQATEAELKELQDHLKAKST
jgi:hypothetical protein